MATLASDYLDTARQAGALIASSEVVARWNEPSALESYSIAGLSGHLARGVITVESYLEQPATPGQTLISAVDYYVIALAGHDPVRSQMHESVRARSDELAQAGPAALAARVSQALDGLAPRLTGIADHIGIITFNGLAISIDQYLRTRLVELVVHLDDLAVSVGQAPPDVGEPVGAIVVATLAEYARRTHGTWPLVRAFARRERSPGPVPAF